MKAALLVVLIAAAGCGGATDAIAPADPAPLPSQPSQPPGPVPRQTAALVDALAGAGGSPRVRTVLTLDSYPSVDTPGIVVDLGDEWVTAFEFATPEQADAIAAGLTPRGNPFGRGQYFWVSDPHFYRWSDRVIVLYVGTSATVLDLLVRVLGPQFAGR
jgi:hypothetical protein